MKYIVTKLKRVLLLVQEREPDRKLSPESQAEAAEFCAQETYNPALHATGSQAAFCDDEEETGVHLRTPTHLIIAAMETQLQKHNLSLAGYFDCDPAHAESVAFRAACSLLTRRIPTAFQELVEVGAMQAALRAKPVSVRERKEAITRDMLYRMSREGTLSEFMSSFMPMEYEAIVTALITRGSGESEPAPACSECVGKTELSAPGPEARAKLVAKLSYILERHPRLLRPLGDIAHLFENLSEEDGSVFAAVFHLMHVAQTVRGALRAMTRNAHASQIDPLSSQQVRDPEAAASTENLRSETHHDIKKDRN